MDNVVVEQFSVPQSPESATLRNGGKELTEDACLHCCSIIRNRRALPGPDVSRLHPSTIPNTHITVDEWKKATNEAIKQRLETRYNDVVHVLLLTWKANDIGSKAPDPGSLVLDEAKALEHVFTDLYGYKTKLFEIPSDSPQLRLQLLFSEILLELDQERQNSKRPLLVVYYNGHGRRSENPHFLDHLIFAAKEHYKMDEPKDPKYPCLSWTDLQPMLEKADIDRLLLFDCCYAAAAVQKISTKSTMEIIASCGREVECAGPKWGGPEKSPFTATLIEVLKKMASRPNGLLAAELQTFLSIHGVLNNQSPNHCVIEGHRRPILLKPLAPTKDESESDQASPAMVAAELNVLIAISFRGDTSVTAEEMANWLGDYQLPNEVVGIEVRSVVESIYESCSTLMEVSIPLWLWALLPDIPGCFFVGFLKSRNLISQFPNLRKEVSKQRTPWTSISSETIDRSIANEHLLKWIIRNDDEQQSSRWSSDPTEVGDEDIEALLAVKRFKYLTNLDLQTRQSNLVLDRKNIQLKSEIDIHSLALLEPTSELVLVEWLGYQESWADGVINSELLRRLTSVAGLLHSQSTSQFLGSLNCRGVFRDSSRQAFGIVYSLPAGGTQPVTLHRLLGSSDRPPLEYRFRLAFNICRFINRFHEVGWLHCNLHSMNLLLFPPEGAENAGWVGEPRILGFVGSRENHHSSFTLGPDDTELGLYQHPDYLERRGRYREEFDYYSVGMLLLEIGFWSTLSKITASNRFRTLPPKESRAVIMARVPKLAMTMGTRYMEATRTCLEGGLLGKPGDSGDGKYAWHASFKSLVMDQISLSEV